MNTNMIYILLVILGFILFKSFFDRKRQTEKQPIGFFLTLHRFFIQKKKLQPEDTMVLAAVGFVAMLSYLLLNLNFTVSLEKDAEAQKKRPRVITKNSLKFEPSDKKEEDFYAQKEQTPLEFEIKTKTASSENENERVSKLIKTYEENVFSSLPAKIESEIDWEAEDLFLSNGEIKTNSKASGGREVVASTEKYQAGDLVLSESTILQPAGQFEVRFFLKAEDNKSEKHLVHLIVLDEHENEILFEKALRGTDFSEAGVYEAFGGVYSRDNVGSVQFKVFFEDEETIAFDRVKATPINITQIYAPEHDFYKTIADASVENKVVRSAMKGTDIPGRLAFGPYEKDIPAGKYRADFYLKVSDNSRVENIALIDIASDASDFHPVYRFLAPVDFQEPNEFQKFSLNFEKPGEGYLEFRVYYYGVDDLFFDKVELSVAE